MVDYICNLLISKWNVKLVCQWVLKVKDSIVRHLQYCTLLDIYNTVHVRRNALMQCVLCANSPCIYLYIVHIYGTQSIKVATYICTF